MSDQPRIKAVNLWDVIGPPPDEDEELFTPQPVPATAVNHRKKPSPSPEEEDWDLEQLSSPSTAGGEVDPKTLSPLTDKFGDQSEDEDEDVQMVEYKPSKPSSAKPSTAAPVAPSQPMKIDYSAIKIKKRPPTGRVPVEKSAGRAREVADPYTKVKRVRKGKQQYVEENVLTRVPAAVVDDEAKLSRSEIYALDDIGEAIKNVVKSLRIRRNLGADETTKLRDAIQKAPFTTVSPSQAHRVLTPLNDLLQIVVTVPSFPDDILADARALEDRWKTGDLSPDLSRGIEKTQRYKPGAGSKRARITSSKLQKDFLFARNAKISGHNDLEIGAWWPLQICVLRDGAHGSLEGGISGGNEGSAVSVILSGGHYEDKDELDTVLYCGTRGEKSPDDGPGKPSHATALMLNAASRHDCVRLIRSSKAGKTGVSRYAPSEGFRYDGLYVVKDYEWLDEQNAMARFVLKRCSNQIPIRWKGDRVRPNRYELHMWEKDAEMWKGDS